MKNAFQSKPLSDPVRRRIELAVAVAQERLLSKHVEHALELLELIGSHIPFDTGLSIYTRLLRLSEDETRAITTRALAVLGERTGGSDPWPELDAVEEHAEEEPEARGPLSFVHHVRQRLRGRVRDELRRWIEVSAATTEVAILECHVENALNFVSILESEVPFNEAIELYLDALDVRDSIAEVTYYTAVARLKDQILPRKPEREAPSIAARVAAAAEDRRLRVVERDGG